LRLIANPLTRVLPQARAQPKGVDFIMWSYYGSKSKVVDYYPPPKFDKIIEPFAGSARYSLKHFDRDILLIDKYEVIVKVWNYLKLASEQDILSLPDLKRHDDIRTIDLDEGARLLIGFCINGGSVTPKNIVCDFQNWNEDKKRIAKNLFKIRHWEIRLDNYGNLDNTKATWFIDPPYQFGGEYYVMPSTDLDFSKLSDWCMSRNGHVIVCENTKANWMDFKPMRSMKGAVHTTTEAIWSNYPTEYDMQQTKMSL
jgi:hypothetical protein